MKHLFTIVLLSVFSLTTTAQGPPGFIECTVTDSFFTPVRFVEIQVVDGTGIKGKATTDSNGKCTIGPIDNGTYDVCLIDKQYTFTKIIAVRVQPNAHVKLQLNNISLNNGTKKEDIRLSEEPRISKCADLVVITYHNMQYMPTSHYQPLPVNELAPNNNSRAFTRYICTGCGISRYESKRFNLPQDTLISTPTTTGTPAKYSNKNMER